METFASYNEAAANGGYVNPITRLNQIGFFRSSAPAESELSEDDFHIIDADAKKIVFQHHAPTYARQKQIGGGILTRLQQLHPCVAEKFQLKPDLTDSVVFRLWAQRETPESREDTYVALSYCWSPDSPEPTPGVKYPLPIPSLMFAALAGERQWRTTGVWIDQLCIDQSNLEEKADSVAAMDTVYRCAQSVVVALLDIQVTAEQQAFLRRFIPDYEDERWGMLEAPHMGEQPAFFEREPVFRGFLNMIFSSRWFTRAWCGHELQSGEQFVFYVPCQPVKEGETANEMLQFTTTFFWHMLTLSSEVPFLGDVEMEGGIQDRRDRLMSVFDYSRRLRRTVARLRDPLQENPIEDGMLLSYSAATRETFALGAGGDPRLPLQQRHISAVQDKTSICLNILGTGLAVVPNLTTSLSEAEAQKQLLLIGLAAGDPTVLCTLGPPLDFSAGNLEPSWLCEPSYGDLGLGARRRDLLPRIPDAVLADIHLDQGPGLRWLKVDVLALPTPQPPSLKLQDLANRIMEKAKEKGIGQLPLIPEVQALIEESSDLRVRAMMDWVAGAASGWGMGRNYEYWQWLTTFAKQRECFVWTLACILECGWKWAVATAKNCGYANPRFLESRIEAARDQLELSRLEGMTWAMSQVGRDAVHALLCIATWMASSNIVNTRPVKTARTASHLLPCMLPHGTDGGKAIVYSATDALTQVVLPVALKNDAYSRLPRVWLLNARGDPLYEKMRRGLGAEWFIRGKSLLLTDVPIRDLRSVTGSARTADGAWMYRAQVKVHGPPPPEEIQGSFLSQAEIEAEVARLKLQS